MIPSVSSSHCNIEVFVDLISWVNSTEISPVAVQEALFKVASTLYVPGVITA